MNKRMKKDGKTSPWGLLMDGKFDIISPKVCKNAEKTGGKQ